VNTAAVQRESKRKFHFIGIVGFRTDATCTPYYIR
jgi:hypothetical protein